MRLKCFILRANGTATVIGCSCCCFCVFVRYVCLLLYLTSEKGFFANWTVVPRARRR